MSFLRRIICYLVGKPPKGELSSPSGRLVENEWKWALVSSIPATIVSSSNPFFGGQLVNEAVRMKEETHCDTRHVEQNYRKALKYFKKAAGKGDV